MTVGELKKKLRDIPNEAVVYTADHDHSEWESNGQVSSVIYIENQEAEFPEGTYAREELEADGGVFKIDTPYVLLKV